MTTTSKFIAAGAVLLLTVSLAWGVLRLLHEERSHRRGIEAIRDAESREARRGEVLARELDDARLRFREDLRNLDELVARREPLPEVPGAAGVLPEPDSRPIELPDGEIGEPAPAIDQAAAFDRLFDQMKREKAAAEEAARLRLEGMRKAARSERESRIRLFKQSESQLKKDIEGSRARRAELLAEADRLSLDDPAVGYWARAPGIAGVCGAVVGLLTLAMACTLGHRPGGH